MSGAARLLTMLLLFAAWPAAAQMALPSQPATEYEQRIDARLPLEAPFTDDGGRSLRLADLFGRKPVVLMLGYYRCPNLCETLANGVLEALSRSGVTRGAYRLVEASVDPRETPALAARKKHAYRAVLDADMHLLTGRRPAIEALAQSAGFQYRYDKALDQYLHPAGFLIATPEGRISRYFMGVRFEPKDVRLALVEASAGRIGSPADRLLLMCSHFDPSSGRYNLAAMALVRAVCLTVLAFLGIWMWRRSARRGWP